MMKMKKLKLSFLLLPLIAAIGLLLAACSSDSDETLVKPEIKIDADTLQIHDGLEIVFQLLNNEGKAVCAFKEGESFTYRLRITNTRSSTVKLPYDLDIIGEDAFLVYSMGGKAVGLPWDLRGSYGPGFTPIEPQESVCFGCTAFGKRDKESYLHDEQFSRVNFIKALDREPLAKGSYYTEFNINLKEIVDPTNDNANESVDYVKCRKEFKIE